MTHTASMTYEIEMRERGTWRTLPHTCADLDEARRIVAECLQADREHTHDSCSDSVDETIGMIDDAALEVETMRAGEVIEWGHGPADGCGYRIAGVATTTEDRILAAHGAGKTLEQIAELLGLDIEEDERGRPMLASAGWVADDGNAEVDFPDAETGEEAAQEYVDGGTWGDDGGWIRVSVWRAGWRIEDDEVVEARTESDVHSVEVEATEPSCAGDDEHDWQSPHEVVGGLEENPGAQGHGGGVLITEVCRHCGAYRVTDTWAQDPGSGREGLTVVRYREADEASRAWLDTLSGEEDSE